MDTELMTSMQADIKKYDGVRLPLKASVLERLLVRRINPYRLHPNPDDEFCMPSIGPNYGIISDYVFKISKGKYWAGGVEDEPVYIEKMYPDNYMILNGHHRWAAALRLGMRRIPVRVVNVTTDKDIDNILFNSSNEKRVALDLDEVVFCSDDVCEKKPFLLPGSLNRENIRLGVPALSHFLSSKGYDIWVYTQKYYSDDYIRSFLKSYHIKATGVVTAFSRKRWKKDKVGESIEKKITDKYRTTLNITNDELIIIEREKGAFEQHDLNCEPADWSKSVINTIKSLNDEKG